MIKLSIKRCGKKVDFHSHFLSPTYYQYLKEYEAERPDRFETPDWSLESHLKQMDRLGIAFSFISVSSPNLSGAPEEVEVRLVRQINQEGAGYARSEPKRIGLYASLPLPHVEASIREAEYAIRELGAFGFGLSTNYAGTYLGDPKYDALLEYLNGISAVIAVHPAAAPVEPEVNKTVPIPAMEFLVETTRTFMNMEMHDIFSRYPAIRWIFPHAGSFLPILSDRINGFSVIMRHDNPGLALNFKEDMRHVYFDCAGFPLQKQLHALLKDVTTENLVYGSDVPYTPMLGCLALSGGLETLAGLSDTDRQRIFYGNALALHPQLAELLELPSTMAHTVNYAENPLSLRNRLQQLPRAVISKLYGKLFK